MFIVDSQVHIWGANTPERPWVVPDPPYTPHRPVPFSKDDLLRELDEAGVSRALLTPTPLDGTRNDLLLEAARLHPDRFGVMGKLEVNAPGVSAQIASWRRQSGMLGLRFNFKVEADPSDDRFWGEIEAAGIPTMMMLASNQLQTIGEAAQRHPGLRLMICHLGIQREARDDAAFAHLDKLLALAKYPNIAVKASGLPRYRTDSYPYRALHPYVRRVYDTFGPRRMFWGTDFTNLKCTYRQAVTLFTEEMPWLTSDDKEWIMGRGVCEWIGWPLP